MYLASLSSSAGKFVFYLTESPETGFLATKPMHVSAYVSQYLGAVIECSRMERCEKTQYSFWKEKKIHLITLWPSIHLRWE